MGPPPSAPPPSLFPPTSVQHVASTSLGLPTLRDNVASALAADTEHRLRLILQDAEKFMRHGKRTTLTADDVKRSLELKGMEPVYGFLPPPYSNAAYMRQPHFRRTMTSTGVVYHVEDQEIDLDAVAEMVSSRGAAAAAATARKGSGGGGGGGGGVGWKAHWLAIEGVQPLIPENPPPYELARQQDADQRHKASADANGLLSTTAAASSTSGAVAPAPGTTSAASGAAAADTAAAAAAAAKQGASASASTVNAQSRPLVKHILSRELQVYYRRLTEAIVHGIGTDAAASTSSSQDTQGDASMRDRSDEAGTSNSASASASANANADADALDPTSLAALSSLRADPGLHQLVPYLCQWISTNISAALALSPSPTPASPASSTESEKRRRVVSRMVSSIEAMVLNDDIGIEGYVHLLLPPLLSVVLVSLPAASYPTALRHKAALLLAHILRKFAPMYPSLKPRITRVLLEAAFMGVGGGGGREPREAQTQGEPPLDMPQPSCSTKLGAVIALRYCGGGMTRALVRARVPASASAAAGARSRSATATAPAVAVSVAPDEGPAQEQEQEQAQTREEPDLDAMDEDVSVHAGVGAAVGAGAGADGGTGAPPRFTFEPKLKALGAWLERLRQRQREPRTREEGRDGAGAGAGASAEITDLVAQVRLCLLDVARASPPSAGGVGRAGAAARGEREQKYGGGSGAEGGAEAGEARTDADADAEMQDPSVSVSVSVSVSGADLRALVGEFWSAELGLFAVAVAEGEAEPQPPQGKHSERDTQRDEVRRGLLAGLGLA